MKGAKRERDIIRVFIISVPIIVETHKFSGFRLGITEKVCQTSLLQGLCLALLVLMHLESCNFLSWTWIIMTRIPTKKIYAHYNFKERVHRFFAWPNFNHPSQMVV